MGLSGKVRLLVSASAPVPVVIGWLRPVVLVPAQLFTGLTTGQLEALLIHELAHIRRHDFPVNLLQSIIGILYFHHPCVRWISSQIRAGREHCCDDTAASLCGGPLPYARALAALEDLRPADAPALCAAATGSPLISRIRRLLVPATPVSPPPLWPAALGTTALAVLLIGIPWVWADEKQPAADQAAPSFIKIAETSAAPAAQPEPAKTQPSPDIASSATVPPLVREKQALETVNAFLNAPTAEDKILWLVPDDETWTAAETFFKRHPEFAKTATGTSFGPVVLLDGGGASLAMEIPGLQGTYFFMIQPTRQGPRIDLLRSTYYQRTLFQDIQNDMPKTPVRVRAIMHPGDYYNKAFADKARHRCYELICPGVDRRFYAYEPLTPSEPSNGGNDNAGAPLENMDLNLRAGLQTLEIRYPASGKDPLQVEIVRIIPRDGAPAVPLPRKPEPPQPKTVSDFQGPGLSMEPSGGSAGLHSAMRRDFGEAVFDKVTLAADETQKPSPEITVSVIKAGSRTRMPAFRLFIGQRTADGGIFWHPTPPMRGEGGEFPLPRNYLPDQGTLRIEADDRIPREYSWENKANLPDELSFALDTDSGTKAQVSMPDGSPAAGAVISVTLPSSTPRSYAVVENGRLRGQDEHPVEPQVHSHLRISDASPEVRPRICKADDQGRFTLPEEIGPKAIVLIIHDAGWLESSYTDFAASPQVRLKSWAKIKGRVLWGGKPGAGTNVWLYSNRPPNALSRCQGETTTDADGWFVFEKMIPGMVGILCPLDAGMDPYPLIVVPTGREALFEVAPGDNTVVIGGVGRTVKGVLRGRDSWEGVTFSIAVQDLPERDAENDILHRTFEKFPNSPEGAPFFRDGLQPSADGSFEIPGILPGAYRIFVTFPGGDGTPVNAGSLIRIDQEEPNEPPAPVDIGELPLATPAASKP